MRRIPDDEECKTVSLVSQLTTVTYVFYRDEEKAYHMWIWELIFLCYPEKKRRGEGFLLFYGCGGVINSLGLGSACVLDGW